MWAKVRIQGSRWRLPQRGVDSMDGGGNSPMRLVQLKAHTSKTQKGLDQSLASAHAHIQRENATAPLRLCARPPVPDGENSP